VKVLIVDDDKLVRKGLIHSMPWKEQGLEITGEAGNGLKAIEWLESEQIDLLITDLAMPVMSGLELVRYVHEHYPHVWVVILTCHQDFEYIQEALRLGAVDYIAKNELDTEEMGNVLKRIIQRIRYGKEKVDKNETPDMFSLDNMSHAVLLIATEQQGDDPPSLAMGWLNSNSLIKLETGCYLYAYTKENRAEQALTTALSSSSIPWAGVFLRGEGNDDLRNLLPAMRHYRNERFFYRYNKEIRIYEETIEGLSVQPPRPAELERLIPAWSSTGWIRKEGRFREQLEEIKQLQLPAHAVQNIFEHAFGQWRQLFFCSLSDTPLVLEPDRMLYFYQWEEWLERIRAYLYPIIQKQQYSEEVVTSVRKALAILNKDIGANLTQEEIARQVNLSRTYFSHCFKEIVGKSFQDHVREQKVAQAKLFLSETKLPVYSIAEQLGYQSENYFSRVFREYTGMLPTEYRKQNRQV